MSELTTKDALLERAVAALEKLKTVMGVVNPVGVVQAFAGSTTPDGWLICDGSAVSRETYAALFAVIKTTYGSGDGSTTFNLPNLTDRFIQGGATAGTVKSAGLPNIEGRMGPFLNNVLSGSSTYTQGAFSISATGLTINDVSRPNPAQNLYGFDFDASRSSSIYGNSTTVQPPALTMRYIIKC